MSNDAALVDNPVFLFGQSVSDLTALPDAVKNELILLKVNQKGALYVTSADPATGGTTEAPDSDATDPTSVNAQWTQSVNLGYDDQANQIDRVRSFKGSLQTEPFITSRTRNAANAVITHVETGLADATAQTFRIQQSNPYKPGLIVSIATEGKVLVEWWQLGADGAGWTEVSTKHNMMLFSGYNASYIALQYGGTLGNLSDKVVNQLILPAPYYQPIGFPPNVAPFYFFGNELSEFTFMRVTNQSGSAIDFGLMINATHLDNGDANQLI